MAVIEGEAGIGKSRLIEELGRRAAGAGFDVLSGAAQELEAERPFGLIREAFLAPSVRRVPAMSELEAATRVLAAPSSARLDPSAHAPDARFQAVDAVADVVEELARRAPMLLVFDDLHWSDPSSLLAVARLARSIETLPVALVCSTRVPPRPAEVDHALTSMLRRGAVHLELPPLHPETVTALVVEAVGGSVGPRLKGLAARAGGNPLLVVELLRALLQEGAISVERGVADVIGEVLPSSVRGAVARRVRLLPPGATDVLRIGAVLGTTFALEDLEIVRGAGSLDLIGIVEELRAAGLLEASGDDLAFRHDLVRQAIYEEMAPGVRRALHARAGRALADAGRPAGLVAAQLSLGAASGDEHAVAWLKRAAREAAALDPASAADLLNRALELTADETERRALAPELVAALVWAGRLVDAESVALRALEDVPGAARRPLLLGLARSLLLQSRWSEAAEQFRELASDPDIDSAERARMLANQALAHAFGLEADKGAEVAAEAESLAVSTRADSALVLALQARSVTALFQGYAHEGIELGARAVDIALGSEDEEAVRIHPEAFQGFALINADRLDEGERMLTEGRERGRRLGTVWDIPLYHWYLSLKHFHSGDWDRAVTELEAGLAVADEVETNWELLNLYGTLANITLHRGDFRRTEVLLREIEERVHPARAPVALIWYAWTRALLAEANGDVAAGYAYLLEQWDKIRARGVVVAARRLGPDLVRLALANDDRPRALEVVEVADLGAERAPFPTSEGTAAHCRGLAERDAAMLVRAAAHYAAGPRPLARAQALEAAGTILQEEGSSERAVQLLQDAGSIYEALAASYDLSRCEALLRDLGIRRARPRRSGRPQSGWESLTETELKVAAHVAEGLTNPEIARRMFVSPRTISTHLKHIFKKLGITSRVELATQATRRDGA